MSRFIQCVLFFTLAFAYCGCRTSQAESPATVPQQPAAEPDKPAPVERLKYLSDLAVDENPLSYNGHEIRKLTKKVKYVYPPGMRLEPQPIDVNYTVIKKHGKVLATFDGIHFPLGNLNDIGLFSFLGGDAKQLFITQTEPRGGRHWIVDLATEIRVLFDSEDYGVGREAVWLDDIDNDGAYEIFLEDPSFYMAFEGLGMAITPLPETIFRYDDRAKKYLPANRHFQEYALKGIDEEIRNLSPEPERGASLAARLRILLRYIYAGKEQEGWAFFDREYPQADREKIRSQVKAVFKKHPFYQFIYRQSAR